MIRFLILLLLASPCLAGGPYGFEDPKLNEEFDRNQHEHFYPNWVYATGSSATLTYAKISSGTFVQVNATTGTINSFMVVGTATNDNAPTLRLGQYIESTASNSNFATTDTYGDLNSISLTAGDWDVTAILCALANGATVTSILTGISTTSGDSSTGLSFGVNQANTGGGPSVTTAQCVSVPVYRMSLAATTTVYQKFYGTYTVATPKGYGRLSARRER